MLERSRCPITENDTEVIFSRPYCISELQALTPKSAQSAVQNKAYEVRYSKEADFYFQSHVLEDHELSLIYGNPNEIHDFEAEISAQKLHWFAHQTEEVLILRQLCEKPRPKVLDFGCNWGKWASMALAHGCEVYGVEVNRAANEFCAKRGIQMLELSQLKGMTFDFINCDQVLEHVSNPMELMNQFSHCLNPEGFLKVSTPSNKQLPHLLRKGSNEVIHPKTLDALQPLIHINLFSRKTFQTLAKRSGLNLYRLPFWKCIGAGQLWNMPRQLNRNLRTPFKRWQGKDTYAWFRKT